MKTKKNRVIGILLSFALALTLKSGKKYYIKIRTYMTVQGEKFYSGWSKVKTVKTK